jgi:hypothetical protein
MRGLRLCASDNGVSHSSPPCARLNGGALIEVTEEHGGILDLIEAGVVPHLQLAEALTSI